MLNSARFDPIDRTVRPCMDTVIYPNTCSIRHLVFDLTRLLSFCSFVSAFPRKPFSQTLFSICPESSLPIYALCQSENRPLIARTAQLWAPFVVLANRKFLQELTKGYCLSPLQSHFLKICLQHFHLDKSRFTCQF